MVSGVVPAKVLGAERAWVSFVDSAPGAPGGKAVQSFALRFVASPTPKENPVELHKKRRLLMFFISVFPFRLEEYSWSGANLLLTQPHDYSIALILWLSQYHLEVLQ
jgi:hypothetical protein